MNAPSRWEDILKESRFDLPQERWEAMEARLRQQIREDRAPAVAKAPEISLASRLRILLDDLSDWLSPAPVRWAGAGALALVALGLGLWVRPHGTVQAIASHELQWAPGQTLEAVGRMDWDWTSGRSRISLQDGAMALETDSDGQIRIQVARGTASFQVDHRAAGESFHVGFSACRIEVVGTAFTIRADSALSSASVEEGRVRFLGPGIDRFLDAGQELSCAAPHRGAHAAPESVPAPAAAPQTTPSKRPQAVAGPSEADIAFEKIAALCHAEGTTCTEARADFVRRFPSDSRAAELGWAWGESAKAAGDLRDALFAWDVASRSDKRIGLRATLAAVELRLGSLPDAERAAKDLDRILPRLEPGSTLWLRAWTLRRQAAQVLGQSTVRRQADSILAQPRAASGGS